MSDQIEVPEGWAVEDGVLHREFVFHDFVAAFAFMAGVAVTAEKLDHHPDWSNSWNKVDVRLVSHDVGRITERDVRLARTMNRLAGT